MVLMCLIIVPNFVVTPTHAVPTRMQAGSSRAGPSQLMRGLLDTFEAKYLNAWRKAGSLPADSTSK